MALCHDVISNTDKAAHQVDHLVEKRRDEIWYEGGSPDEVELVTTAKDLGIAFNQRVTQKEWEVLDLHEQVAHKFEMLCKIDFTSERKRMTVVVRDPKSNQLYVLSKGADSVMIDKDDSHYHILQEHLNKFARAGHRTLAYGMKVIEEGFFKAWKERLATTASMKSSEDK